MFISVKSKLIRDDLIPQIWTESSLRLKESTEKAKTVSIYTVFPASTDQYAMLSLILKFSKQKS
jgi:hypothetical protein